jgi:NADP-dependent 3-hydroxy acid dehydrogenase YdfG
VTTPARSQLPVAVVTGGNRGVGLEICRQLAMAGYAVVLGSRDPRKAELAAKEIDPEGERITPCHIEVDNSVNIEQLTGWIKERYGRVDTLVNNASVPPDLWAIAGTTDLTPVAEALDINLFGAWRVTQALLPLLRRSPRPRIVNVSSEGGSIALMNGGRPAYSVSKAALNALTKMLAGELYRDGILVNADGRALSWLCGPQRPASRRVRFGPGERPAARRQPRADPVDVRVVRRGVGDLDDRLLDRFRRLGVGGGLQLSRDEADVLVRELAAEEGEQRDVVVLGHAFRVAGPQPFDDLAKNWGEWHCLHFL